MVPFPFCILRELELSDSLPGELPDSLHFAWLELSDSLPGELPDSLHFA